MGASLLKEKIQNIFTAKDLKDGQIAVMVDNAYDGTIVQRYGDNLVAIGQNAGYGWSGCNNNSLTVRILEDGELIKIFNNQ
jgi:hypothetical protein